MIRISFILLSLISFSTFGFSSTTTRIIDQKISQSPLLRVKIQSFENGLEELDLPLAPSSSFNSKQRHSSLISFLKGLALSGQGNYDEAKQKYVDAQLSIHQLFGVHSSRQIPVLENIIFCLFKTGSYQELDTAFRFLHLIHLKNYGPNDERTVSALESLAFWQSLSEQWNLALFTYEQALETTIGNAAYDNRGNLTKKIEHLNQLADNASYQMFAQDNIRFAKSGITTLGYSRKITYFE